MEIKTTDYDGIKLTEYKGIFSIEAQRAKDDKFYPVWAKYQKGKDEFQEKSWPVKVVLGGRFDAIDALKSFVAELEKDLDTPTDGIPF
jgi:hypothetical protein